MFVLQSQFIGPKRAERRQAPLQHRPQTRASAPSYCRKSLASITACTSQATGTATTGATATPSPAHGTKLLDVLSHGRCVHEPSDGQSDDKRHYNTTTRPTRNQATHGTGRRKSTRGDGHPEQHPHQPSTMHDSTTSWSHRACLSARRT